MSHFLIEGRQYDFPENLKLGEIRLIKQIAGVGMNQIEAAMAQGDPDVLAAFVLIAMRRAGRRIELEQVDELDITEIGFDENGTRVPLRGSPVGKDAAADGSPVTTPPSSGNPPTATGST